MILVLDRDECMYLALELSANIIWPDTVEFHEYARAGGPAFRIRFLSSAQGTQENLTFVMSEEELWLLDTFLLPRARTEKMPSGRSVKLLQEKVWEALTSVDSLLLGAVVGEVPNGRNEDAHAVAHESGTSD